MFIHSFKYSLLRLLRNKSNIFWCLCFPIILGTFFSLAFGHLSADELFSSIPVAIVNTSDSKDYIDAFKDIADNTSNEDTPLIDPTYVSKKEALSLLEEQKIDGIIYVDEQLDLTISVDMKNSKLNQSILSSFVEQYNISKSVIEDIAKNHPENIEKAIDLISVDTSYNKEDSVSKNTVDVYVQYFFNLIAMICLFSSLSGLEMVINSQGNLSNIGARTQISPVNRLLSIPASLLASTVVSFGCNFIAIIYMNYILKVNFGDNILLVLLAALVGTIAGISLGFFVGSINQYSEGTKVGILMTVSLSLCFLSGLMVGNMRIVVEHFFPILNRISPAAVISDCFYSLIIYDTYTRFITNIITLLVISFLLSLGGFLCIRRSKYASL